MDPIDAAGWASLNELFFAALECTGAERSAYLERACVGRPALRAQLEALLAAHEQTQGLGIERTLLRDEAGEDEAPSRDGTRAGPWRLERRLGQGGMGEVWLAERADGDFRQQAAIKFLRSGWRPADLLARFRRERQLLARLAHPNIARLLDGGTTEQGEPYLAMEFVEGQPLTAWCDERGLPVRERLRVFARVCEAVRFAHANLVVHRDLKPANILVTPEGRPVLLDFGIAKLLQPDEPGEGDATVAGERVLTPEYAAPEQLRGEPITTATDVWGLGVLLYELLTGERPFRVAGGSTSEIERRVLETEPRRASEAVRARAGTAPHDALAPATRRGTTSAGLASALRGDLDAIVQRALAKEPARRYQSAEQLGGDVERWLRGLPVQARPDAFVYRLAKYVRRHRTGVAAAAALSLSLLAFGVVATVQARRIARERDRSRAEEAKSARVLDVLVDLFQIPDPRRVQGGDTLRMRDVLRIAEDKIAAVEDQPEIQARLWEALAEIRRSRSELQRQRVALEQGIAAAERAQVPDLVLRLRRSQAMLVSRLEGVGAAEPLLQAVLAESEARYGPNDERLAAALAEYASITGTSEERLARLERSLSIRRRLAPRGSVETAASLNMLGGYWTRSGDEARALRYYEESRDMAARFLPDHHPDRMLVEHNVAMTLLQQGRFEEALAIDQRLLPARRRVTGIRSTAVAASLTGIGYSLANLGRHAAAAESLAAALDILDDAIGPEGHAASGVERALTLSLFRAGRTREANAHLTNVLASAGHVPGGPVPDFWLVRMRLAAHGAATGNAADWAFMREALARIEARARTPRQRLDALNEMGAVALTRAAGASPEDAEGYFARAAALADSTSPTHPARACARCGLLAARAQAGRVADRASLRAEWERCRGWGYVPTALAAPVERLLAGR